MKLRPLITALHGWWGRMRKNEAVWFYLRGTLSVGALALLLYLVDFGEVARKIANSRLTDMAAAFAVLSLMPILAAWRWRAACQPTTSQSSYWTHLRIGLIGSFYGQVLPTSAGVEVVRIWLYSRVIGSVVRAASGVLADRISGLATMLLLIVVCYPLQRQVIHDGFGRTVAASLSLFSLGGLLTLFALVLPLGSRIGNLLPFDALRQMATELKRSLGFSPSTAKLIGLSLAMQATTLTALWFIARALGAEATPLQMLVLVPPAFLALLIPLSISGWGLREGAFVLFLSFGGIPSDVSLAMSLLLGVALILLSLPGSLFALMRGELPPAKREAES